MYIRKFALVNLIISERIAIMIVMTFFMALEVYLEKYRYLIGRCFYSLQCKPGEENSNKSSSVDGLKLGLKVISD